MSLKFLKEQATALALLLLYGVLGLACFAALAVTTVAIFASGLAVWFALAQAASESVAAMSSEAVPYVSILCLVTFELLWAGGKFYRDVVCRYYRKASSGRGMA